MSDPNLKAALELSLENMDENGNDKPIREADPQSLAILWERVTEKLVLGLPDEIEDSDIAAMVKNIRAQRHRWEAEADAKPPRSPRKKPGSVAEALGSPKVLDWT